VPAGPRNSQPHRAVKVLAEVRQIDSRLRVRERHRLEHLGHAHRFEHLRNQPAFRGLYHMDRLPARVVEAGLSPAGHFQPRIVFLAVELVVRPDGPVGGGAPALVADHFSHRAVVIFDVELQKQFWGSRMKESDTAR